MASVRELWERIHVWLAAHASQILKMLNAPASELDLQKAEQTFGCRMPADWRELYLTHNGMKAGNLFCTMRFLTLEDVIREHANSNTTNATPFPIRASDRGVQKADMHNPKWIPFAHDYGETLLRIDLDPTPEGTAEQIIFTDHADDTVIVLAKSLREFLANFVNDLEAGRYFLSKEALADGDEWLACQGEIDVVNWAFSPRWKHLQY